MASSQLTVIECSHYGWHGELPLSGTGVPCHSDVVVSEWHKTSQQE